MSDEKEALKQEFFMLVADMARWLQEAERKGFGDENSAAILAEYKEHEAEIEQRINGSKGNV